MNGLIDAFANLLKRIDVKETIENVEKEVPREVFTVADKISFIRLQLSSRKEMSFFDLFTRHSTKNEMITTFQALLELLKHQYLTFEQDDTFGDITLRYNENNQGEEIGELSEYN